MPMHAEHAVISYDFSNFSTQVKNTQTVKILKNRFGNLQMGSKTTIRNFIYGRALKRNCFAHAQQH
jgi:hypothetical protein